MPRLFRTRSRRGISLLYAVIAMVALCAFVSLAVDLGRVQLAKTELMRAADAAARAAAAEMSAGSNLTTIQTAASNIAAANKCDGTAVSLTAATDIEFGTWDINTKTFTALPNASYTSANALRVTARRTSASSNPIPLSYGRILGLNNCDVKATVISYLVQNPPAITGLNMFDAHKNLFVASYNPNSVLNPGITAGLYLSNGQLGSNTTIDLGTSGDLWGDEYRGPSCGVTSNGVVHGTTRMLSANISTPTMPAFTPVTNPGGVSATPTITTNVTWPAGTYYFTSITWTGNDDKISFSGPATVYMNGNLTTTHDRNGIIPYNSLPSNLTWYQASGTTFSSHNEFQFGGKLIGPASTFTANDKLDYTGAIIVGTLNVHDDAHFFRDETLAGSSAGSGNISSVR